MKQLSESLLVPAKNYSQAQLKNSPTSKETLGGVVYESSRLHKEGASIRIEQSSSSQVEAGQARGRHSEMRIHDEEDAKAKEKEKMMQSPFSFSPAKAGGSKASGLAKRSGGEAKRKRTESQGDSYEDDQFVDGEETPSQEVKRSNFSIESMTEEHFTPLHTNNTQEQIRLRDSHSHVNRGS